MHPPLLQVLRDIVAKTLFTLSCKLGPGQDPVHSYADLAYQWEQLLKAAPPSLQRTLTDNFQGLVRELLQPRPSLERLEIVIRRVGFLLMQELPLDLHNINSMVNMNMAPGPAQHAHHPHAHGQGGHGGHGHNVNVSRAITPPSSSIYSAYPPGQEALMAVAAAASDGWGNRGQAPGTNSGTHTGPNSAELPRRPFKSRECDFYKQGKCNKDMCNFAHGNGEKDWWTAKYQSMMPCKTPGCPGRAAGCPLAHAPEEQNMAKREYDDVVAAATAVPMSSVPSRIEQPAFSPYIIAPDSAVPTPSLSPAPPRQWLGKNELPRPFRSKLCDFFATNGVCAKQMCNYAHEASEIVMWSSLFQTMFRCNTKGCPGRQSGVCSFSHTPEEQLASRAKYEELVAHARSVQQREESGHWEANRSPRSEVSMIL